MKKTIILLAAFAGLTAHAQSWNLTGNSGTNSGTDFIGTTDFQSLVFKTDNTEKFKVTPSGKFIFYNITSPGQIWDKNLMFGSGLDNFTGSGNVVFGIGALTQNLVGHGNTAVGNNSASLMGSGGFNSSFGLNSMRFTEAGSYNVALGMNALEYFREGNGNVAVGVSAMGSNNLRGNNNIAVRESAFRYINKGDANVVIGALALHHLEYGSNNINIGSRNGYDVVGGNDNIFIGTNIVPYTIKPESELNIGNWIVGNNGTIGIGKFDHQLPANGVAADGERYKLFVKDGIKTEKVKVDIAADNGWADYVFEKDYKLMPLKELDQFISKNGHLPEVPTTAEAIKNGIELKEMNILLLKKIEELTLYTIEQQKRIEALENKSNISK